MTKRTVWGLATLASAWGIAADFPSYTEGDWGALASTIGAPVFAIAGAVAAQRRPENRTGVLLLLTAFVWPLGSLYKHEGILFQQVAALGAWLWIIPLIYLVLAFPSGRLERRKDAFLCWLVSVPAFWLTPFEFPLFDFHAHGFSVTRSNRPMYEAIESVVLVFSLVAAGMLVARVREKWRRASEPGRRALAPVVITGTTCGVAAASLILGLHYISLVKDHDIAFGRVVWVIAATVPIGFLIGLARARARRARMGELVIELGELPTPERFQDALRKALGDPNLIAAFWVPADRRYLTAEGETLIPPDHGGDSVATFLERDGEPLAVIVHDRFLMDDPGLVAGATAAARLAVENERLQQEVLEQLVEVRASRSRIIQAGDDARRKLERDLHDGAQQRLITAGLHLQRLATNLGPADAATSAALEEARSELKGAVDELRDLARGLHPLVLTEEGLGPAVETLCHRAPLAVAVGEVPTERLPEATETAAYFVVSEALTNIAKHAHATSAEVSMSTDEDSLTISVSDDGIGGASLASGSGLRGLADRVEALDGSFTVASPPGAGTRITAQLPKVSRAFDAPPAWEIVGKEPALAARREERSAEATLLRVRALEVFHGEQQVLFDIDLDVANKEIVAVLGTNGAGKSTLARTLAGLHDHLRGSIRLNGVELTDVMPEHRSRAGLVFIEGGSGVFQPLTVDENLRLFTRHAGIPLTEGRARAFDAFPVLAARRSQRASSMSRGEQHMLALARAVMCSASLVIVDELTLGLAPGAADDVCQHLRSVNEGGSAIVFIEQSVWIASRLAEHAYFLDAGRVVFDGPIDDLNSSGLLVPTWIDAESLAHV